MQTSLSNLPPPSGINRVIFRNGYNTNIIEVLNKQFPAAVNQCKNVHFSGSNLKEKARAIYNYLRSNVNYQKDPSGKQLIQLPSRMLNGTKKGDCKSLSLAAAAFIKCAGAKNVFLRYASYSPSDKTPTHVYCVFIDENGKQIIIDPVFKQFNKEAKYQSKKDYQMEIAVLSGTPSIALKRIATFADLRTKVRPGGLYYNVINNRKAAAAGERSNIYYPEPQKKQYLFLLKRNFAKCKNPAIKNILQAEIKSIESGNFKGTIYSPRSGSEIKGLEDEIGKLSLKKVGKKLKKIKLKNIVKGVKAVSFVAPRKAFLALVALNFRGIATRLTKLSDGELTAIWVKKFGGKLSVLKKSISRGSKKRPLFGSGKKVKSIKGIGVVIDETNQNIGAAPVAAAAVIAAAAPILVAVVGALKGKGVPEVPENAAAPAESGNFTEANETAQEEQPGLVKWINKAVDIAKSTGIIPEKPETKEEEAVNKAIPGDDLETEPGSPATPGSGFKISPVILIGAAAAAGLLLMRKK